jgi:hypothetical protein
MEELKTIKQAVKEVLEECPKARNSDKLLTILVFRKLGFGIWIEDLKNSPSFESIRRMRQRLQNTEGICPPEEDIDAMRNKREVEFREVFIR